MTPRHTPVVMFARAVPTDAPLVVRTNRGTRVLFGFLVVAMALEALVFVGLVALTVWTRTWAMLGIVAVWLPMGYFLVLAFREYLALLGPQLAADHTGMWVRTGIGRHPEVVFLPWRAVDGVDLARGPAVRITSRQGEGLYGRRRHWRVRTAWRRFGTPFIVDGRRSAEAADVIAHRLRQLAEWIPR